MSCFMQMEIDWRKRVVPSQIRLACVHHNCSAHDPRTRTRIHPNKQEVGWSWFKIKHKPSLCLPACLPSRVESSRGLELMCGTATSTEQNENFASADRFSVLKDSVFGMRHPVFIFLSLFYYLLVPSFDRSRN